VATSTSVVRVFSLGTLAVVARFALAYFLLAELSNFLSYKPSNFATFWLPSGLFVAVLLLNKRTSWPWFILGAYLANVGSDLIHSRELLVSFSFCTGNCLEALAGAWLVQRFISPQLRLASLREVLGLIACAAMISTAVSATIGSAVIHFVLHSASFWSTWRTWWSGDLLGVIIIAPPLLVFAGYDIRQQLAASWPRALEALTIITSLVGAEILLAARLQILDVYIVVPILLWAVIRFDLRGGTVAMLAMSFTSVYLASQGWSHNTPELSVAQNAAALQVYLSINAFSVLLLGVVLRERESAALKLKAEQQALRAERDRAQNVLDTTQALIVALDRQGRITLINQTGCKMLGYSEDELLGRDWFTTCLPQPEGAQQMRPVFETMIAGQWPGHEYYENEIVQSDGTRRNIAWHNNIFRDDAGVVTGILSAGTDITAAKEAEAALLRSTERLELAEDAANIGIWDWDVTANAIEWTPQMFSLFRLDPAHASASFETWRSVLHPADLALAEAKIMQALRDHTELENDYRICLPDGQQRWISAAGKGIYGADQQPIRMVGICTDITQRKSAEEELQRALEKLSATLNALPDLLFEVDCQGLIYDYRAPHTEMLFVSPERFLGKNIAEVIPQPAAGIILAAIAEAASTGLCQGSEYHLDMSDKTRWFELSIAAKDDSAAPDSMLVVLARDVTERKQAETQLWNSAQDMRAILNATSESTFLIDLNGIVLGANPTAAERLGLTLDELLGACLLDHIPEENRQVRRSWIDELVRTGEPSTHEDVRSGVMLEHNLYPVKDDNGQVVKVAIFARDITERKQAEATLRQAQKVEALGTLAGGIAHDFNNLLFVILGNAELTREQVAPGSLEHESLSNVILAGQRAKELVQQILAFSRKAESKYQTLDLSKLLGESLHLLRGGIPRSIEIRQVLDRTDKAVYGDATEIHQVLMNLCVNAAQAIEPNPGVIEVSLRQVVVEPDALPGLQLTPGVYLELTVGDTGTGISPQAISKIFDPYYTTKDTGKGTGLGLSVVHGIVMRMGGAITVDSTIGQGTRFIILLPAVEPEPAASTTATAQPVRLSGQILVVDDEPENLRLMSQLLAKLGCQATCTASAMDAWDLLHAHPGRYTALITDQSMPQVKGIQLAKMIQEARIDLPVILYTGFGDEIDDTTLANAGISLGLSKPVSITELAQGLQLVLGAPK
jgi:PAS domain S-box-containing protein